MTKTNQTQITTTGTDNLSFALEVIRKELAELELNNAPIQEQSRIRDALATIEELRDICQKNKWYQSGLVTPKEAIYRHVEKEHFLADLEEHIREKGHNLSGLTPDEVLGDEEMLSVIIRLYDKSELGEEHWYALQSAIERGVKNVLEGRKAL